MKKSRPGWSKPSLPLSTNSHTVLQTPELNQCWFGYATEILRSVSLNIIEAMVDWIRDQVRTQAQTSHSKSIAFLVLCWFPRWCSGKEPACQCRKHRRLVFNAWVRKVPWNRRWNPHHYSWPENSMEQRNLAGYSPWSHKESDTTAWPSKCILPCSLKLLLELYLIHGKWGWTKWDLNKFIFIILFLFPLWPFMPNVQIGLVNSLQMTMNSIKHFQCKLCSGLLKRGQIWLGRNFTL